MLTQSKVTFNAPSGSDFALGHSSFDHWQTIARLTDGDLARLDIGLVNLCCAVGLPGCELIDFDYCTRTLDQWSIQTRNFTNRMMHHFYEGRSDYAESEQKYRIQVMITFLQRNLGLRFRMDRRSEDAVLEPADTFINGIIQGQGGTCGSLPILYAAIGRRLGYPLRLVQTRCHLYLRWETQLQGICFNIEASGDGVSFLPDGYYCSGSYAMPKETIHAFGYMKSLDPREELASFLLQRGECWMQEKNYREAALSYAWANELDPERQQHRITIAQSLRKWNEQLRDLLPKRNFPKLDVGLPPPYYRNMPRAVERQLICNLVLENALNNPAMKERWWHPMRRNPSYRPSDLPEVLRFRHKWDRPTAL